MPLRQNSRRSDLSLESTSSFDSTMSSRDSSVQRSGLESPATRSGTSSTISSTGNYMGLQCSFYGCTRLCLTGGPFCTLHSEVNRRASSYPMKSSSTTNSPARLSPIDIIARQQGNTVSNISTHALNNSRLSHESNYHKTHIDLQGETSQNAPRTSNTEQSTNRPGKALNSKGTARKGGQNPLKSNNAAQVAPSITVATSPQIAQNAYGKQSTETPSAEHPSKKQRMYIENDEGQLRSQSSPQSINGLKHLGANANGLQSNRNGPLPTSSSSFSLRPEKRTGQPIRTRIDDDVRSAAEAGRESGHNQGFFLLIDNGDAPAESSSHSGPHVKVTERTDPIQSHRNYSDKLPSILQGYPFGDASWNMAPIRKPVDDLKTQQKWTSSQPQSTPHQNRYSRSPESRGSPVSSQVTRDRDEGQIQTNGRSGLTINEHRHFRPKPKARVQRGENSSKENQGGRSSQAPSLAVQSPRKPKSVAQHTTPKLTMPEIVDLTSDLVSDSTSNKLLPPKPKPSDSGPLGEVRSGSIDKSINPVPIDSTSNKLLSSKRKPSGSGPHGEVRSGNIDKRANPFSVNLNESVFQCSRRTEPILEKDDACKNTGPCSFELDELLVSGRTTTGLAVHDKAVDQTCEPVLVDADGPSVQHHQKGLFEPENFMDTVPEDLNHAASKPTKQYSRENNEIDNLSCYIYGPLNEPNRPGSALYGLPPPVSTRPAAHFRHFDPRVHWTKARPQSWYSHKQSEITIRGNRKSRINQKLAVAGSTRQRDGGLSHQELPSRVYKSPGWVAALDELDTIAENFREKMHPEDQHKQKEKDKATPELSDCLVRGYEWATNGSARTISLARGSKGTK